MSPYLYNDDAYVKMFTLDDIGECVANMFMVSNSFNYFIKGYYCRFIVRAPIYFLHVKSQYRRDSGEKLYVIPL